MTLCLIMVPSTTGRNRLATEYIREALGRGTPWGKTGKIYVKKTDAELDQYKDDAGFNLVAQSLDIAPTHRRRE